MSLASNPLWASISVYLHLAAPYLAVVAVILGVVAVVMEISLRRRFKRLALGRTGSVEESVTILMRDLKELQGFRGELEKYLKLAEARLRGSVSGLGIVRFNPFGGVGQGGNQSSAIALIDETGQGVVLSTLYSRDRVAVYAKPIEAHTSSYELTAEEKEAIGKAKERVAKIKHVS
ncbi:MAG TPA: DUF4446 family protein [Candidatus Paceibacterota bacterium]